MLVSVIIPCFNSGSFLLEALASCFDSTYKEFEVLVIDDGSTEEKTLEIIEEIQKKYDLRIIHKSNGGPASARNLGIENSKGDFLFFLDSDNKMHADYLSKAVEVFQSNPNVGVVYSKPGFFGNFGSEKTRFEAREFSLDSILSGNYIDMCSLVRREVIQEVGGFDEHKDLIGWEDWDLWIRIAQTKWKFHFLKEVLFDYRVRPDSLMGSTHQHKKVSMLRYLGSKHGFLIHSRYRKYFKSVEKIHGNPFSYFFRIIFYKYFLGKKLFQE
jgi:glycosyltransferase involved in cell wall biosynthesis